MADTKLVDLTALTAPSGDDLLYVVDNPAGTPADRKLALDNLFTRGTVTTSSPVIDAAQTWNAGAVTFTAIKLNVTNTASSTSSRLLDLQVGGISQFYVTRGGTLSNDNGVIGIVAHLQLIFGSNPYILLGGTYLRNRASANLQLGNADAAAPVAQTLSVQSVVAGTSNTAGSDFTITGSQGTGTGAGGSLIFQVAPAGTTGTAQNALSTALTIDSTRRASFAAAIATSNGTAAAPNLTGATANTGLVITDAQLQFTFSGVSTLAAENSSNGIRLAGAIPLGWVSGAANASGLDIALWRDAANTLAQRNGTNAQEARVYGSYTSATNYQRMSIKTLRESSGALSGASYTTTIAIPAYANLIGVTTRVTTAVTGATTYDVGDGTDVDLWGAAVGVALGSQSQTANFTAVGAVGASATSRTVTLTANGSNFTGGVVEICLHYLTTEAD